MPISVGKFITLTDLPCTYCTSHALKYVTHATTKIHNTIGNRIVLIERRQFIASLWPRLSFRTHLCLFIVQTLLFAIVRSRRKLRTLAHGEAKGILIAQDDCSISVPQAAGHLRSATATLIDKAATAKDSHKARSTPKQSFTSKKDTVPHGNPAVA